MRPVYNMTVDGAHCYYANGVLVHNCDTLSMAMRHLRDTGLIVRGAEWTAKIDDDRLFKGNTDEPLYPI